MLLFWDLAVNLLSNIQNDVPVHFNSLIDPGCATFLVGGDLKWLFDV